MRSAARTLRRAQRGAVLFIALIVLVAMSLAGLAMMRGVDTGAMIANNLAFKEGATMAADTGVEAARTWLLNNPGATLYNNQPGVTNGAGYFATWQEGLDFIKGDADATNDFDWTANSVALATDAAGNQANYVIHRMCDATGDPASINCIRVSSSTGSTSSSSKGAAAFGTYAISSPSQAFFRITVRVIGPRNTVSYVQAVVY
jgi:type IV pilus assembly protein PilX